MDTCFIFGAETFYGRYRKPQPGEYIIAANAGLRTCQQMGLTSVFCLGGNAHGVDLEGGQYSLHDATLTAGVSSGGSATTSWSPRPVSAFGTFVLPDGTDVSAKINEKIPWVRDHWF